MKTYLCPGGDMQNLSGGGFGGWCLGVRIRGVELNQAEGVVSALSFEVGRVWEVGESDPPMKRV